MADPSSIRDPYAIDVEELEKLCALHCTQEEICAWFRRGVAWLQARRSDREKKYEFPIQLGDGTTVRQYMTIAEIMERGYARGRISLRRQQIKLLEAGGSGAGTMAVWLGKQILGQRDTVDMRVEEVTAPDESYAESVRRRIISLAKRLESEEGTGPIN